MATQTITVDAFQTLMAEASDAIAAEDWKTAKSKLAQAEMVHSALEYDITDGAAGIRRREALNGAWKAVEAVSSYIGRSNEKNRFYKTKTSFRRSR